MSTVSDAISQSDFKAATQLMQDGAEWNLDGFMARQAVDKIIRAEAFDLLTVLFEKEIISPDIFEYDRFDGTAFETLAQAPCTDALLSFMENITPDIDNIDDELQSKTWLSLAIAAKSDPRFIDILIGAGCDIQRVDKREQNYLFGAPDLTSTEYLINQGLDVNKQDLSGRTPFFSAVRSKDKALMQLYIDNGADINLQDNKGETVYNIVCFELLDPEIFEFLAEFEPPNHDQRNTGDQTLLMQYSNSPIDWDSSIALLECLIKSGGNIYEESVDAYGRAVTSADLLAPQNEKILAMLIGLDDFDPDAIDNQGNNWLHRVTGVNLNFEESKAKSLYKKVKILLKAGVDPAAKNDDDKSPMDLAQDDNLKSKALEIMMKAAR